MAKIRGIVFDMDGVLIDAKEWHYEALNKALKLFGYEISRYDHLVTYDGLPTRKKLEMLSRERGLPKKLHNFINDLKQKYTVEHLFIECNPIFQHEYALSTLKNDGYKLAVASNSIRHTVELMLKKANLLPYLEFFLSNQDVSKSKPDPEIYVTATNKLNLMPNDVLVVEDNINGIRAAKGAKTHVMKVDNVYDVTYDNIKRHIFMVENGEV